MSKKGRKEKAGEVQESIRRILFQDWDPIGVKDLFADEGCADDDEYDSYVGGIYRLLASGADEHKIIERLHQLEINSMGLAGVNSSRDKLKRVAERLLELNVTS